ncbi:MAG: methyltransferase domain-containing protein [Verrucomicrobiota bacterium]|nr:methyltransferase domain-containing protein [Verrucomicrobiota bacterium]
MAKPSKDALAAIDFAALYRRQAKASSFEMRSREDWDQRAQRRSRHEKGSDYARAFLARMDLHEVHSVLDIGCGSGNLALPLAKKVKQVHAVDFSSGMLSLLRAQARKQHLKNIRTTRLAWTDEWPRVPKTDVVVCSRAMSVEDARAALIKMDALARKRCYLTVHAGGSFMSEDVYRVLRRTMIPRPNYMYVVNILYQLGIQAKVDFLNTSGGLAYEGPEAFVEGIRWRIGRLTSAEEKRLRTYFESLPRDAKGRSQYRHDFVWAFLSWEKG